MPNPHDPAEAECKVCHDNPDLWPPTGCRGCEGGKPFHGPANTPGTDPWKQNAVAAIEVLEHVLSEVEMTRNNLPGATSADYAADIVRRLNTHYLED